MPGTAGARDVWKPGLSVPKLISLPAILICRKILELTLNDGFDKRTGKQIGLKTGTATDYRTYEELFAAYKAQVQHFMRIKLTGNNIIERIFMKYMPVPFLSVLTCGGILKEIIVLLSTRNLL